MGAPVVVGEGDVGGEGGRAGWLAGWRGGLDGEHGPSL